LSLRATIPFVAASWGRIDKGAAYAFAAASLALSAAPAAAGCNSGPNRNTALVSDLDCQAKAPGFYALAIGAGAEATGSTGIAIGPVAKTGASNGIAVAEGITGLSPWVARVLAQPTARLLAAD